MSNEQTTFVSYIRGMIGEANVLVFDGESVDDVKDYKSVINELFQLTKGKLQLNHFNGTEDDELRNIVIVTNLGEFAFEVETSNGWIDNNNFVKGLNQILIDHQTNSRFYWFWANDSFGQEVGFFYSDQDTAERIYEYARQQNEEVDEMYNLLQISDGEHEEGLEDL